MEKRDISFKIEEENIKFNFRVAALLATKDKILLQSTTDDNFLSLLGGRVQFFEDTKSALIRECKEEIGIEFKEKDLKLLDIVENFFTYNNTKYHEILYIYKIKPPKKLIEQDTIKTLDKDNSINKWYDIKEIEKLNIKPEIIKQIYSIRNIRHDILKNG